MIVIPNEKLLAVAKDAGFFESFRIADDVLRQGVQGISDIITIPGIINRDFADVKTTMAGMGHAVMGTAIRSGANRAIEAAQAAMASPLLEAGAIDGARGILINITGSSSLKLSEVNEASSLIQSSAHEDANIIFGAVLDEKMGDDVKITVIATGFRDQMMPERRARMLSVEEAPVVSVPLVAVPVESPNNWLNEKKPAAPCRACTACAARATALQERRRERSNEKGEGRLLLHFFNAGSGNVRHSRGAALRQPRSRTPNFERAQTDRSSSSSIQFEEPIEPKSLCSSRLGTMSPISSRRRKPRPCKNPATPSRLPRCLLKELKRNREIWTCPHSCGAIKF